MFPRMLLIAVLLAQGSAALADNKPKGDAVRGETLFSKCKSCHMIGDDAKNKVGPVLTGVVGRFAGSLPGFKYSKSMKAVAATGFAWEPETLDTWLAQPTKFLRARLGDKKAKSKMSFRLKKPQDRLDVIAYLATFSSADMAIETGEGNLCVTNGSDHRHFFASEPKARARLTGWLDPGASLCAPDSAGIPGTVSVFEVEDTLEGCSRLVAKGEETLVKYADFDRCEWGSHKGGSP